MSHLGKRKIILEIDLSGDMLVFRGYLVQRKPARILADQEGLMINSLANR